MLAAALRYPVMTTLVKGNNANMTLLEEKDIKRVISEAGADVELPE